MYCYYPSCNFTRLFPDAAAAVRRYLEAQEDVKIAGCCHETAGLPGPDDVVVTVCMSCMRILDEVRADVPQISLYEFLLTRKDFPWPDCRGEQMVIQDCFRARGKHGLHVAARECLRRCGVSIVEMPHNRDEETFDGSFLFHPPYSRNVKEAPAYFGGYLPEYVTEVPEEEWPERFRLHARSYPPLRVACYCNACAAAARQGGADAVHLARLLTVD